MKKEIDFVDFNRAEPVVSSQDLSIEGNYFKRDGKVTKITHLLFHRIWNVSLMFMRLKSDFLYIVK